MWCTLFTNRIIRAPTVNCQQSHRWLITKVAIVLLTDEKQVQQSSLLTISRSVMILTIFHWKILNQVVGCSFSTVPGSYILKSLIVQQIIRVSAVQQIWGVYYMSCKHSTVCKDRCEALHWQMCRMGPNTNKALLDYRFTWIITKMDWTKSTGEKNLWCSLRFYNYVEFLTFLTTGSAWLSLGVRQ